MNTKKMLQIYGLLHGLIMLAVTVFSSSQMSIFDAGYLFDEPWFIATITDAYLGFIMVWLWMVAVENSWTSRILWLGLTLTLGNIAMGGYVFYRASKMAPNEGIREFLSKRF